MRRGRIVGTVDSITIALPAPNAADVGVPDVFGALDQRYSHDFGVAADAAKQAQRHAGRVLGKNREVYTRAVRRGAERIRRTGQNFKSGLRHFDGDTNGKLRA